MKKSPFLPEPVISTRSTSFFPGAWKNRFAKRGALLSYAVAGSLLMAATSRAIDVTWSGGINGNWSNAGNWDAGEPFSEDSIIFPNAAQTTSVRADFSSYPETDPRAFAQPALQLQATTFATAAPAYAIELYTSAESSTSFYQANLIYDGAGITNSSSVMQNFVIDPGSNHAEANGDYTGIDGSRLTFSNSASAGTNVTYHAQAGATAIVTQLGTTLFLRPSGSTVFFNDNASAASATFIADGGAGNGGLPAFIEFHNNSTAASGNFASNGGALGANGPGGSPPSVCGFGGETIFFDTASAGTAHFTINGTPGAGGSGGLTKFTQNSTAANGVFVTNPAADSHVGSGIVQFFDTATAANGNFTNTSGPESVSNGFTQFWDNTTAANAVFDNLGGAANYGGTTSFNDHSTAATAVINNRGLSGGGNGGLAGDTGFYGDSTASNAVIHNWTGPDSGGITEFHGNATAANSHIILEPGNNGGTIIFHDNATAGSAHLDAGADGATGLIDFRDQSTAANSLIDLGDNAGFDLHLRFFDSTSAGDAIINAGSYSYVQFYNDSTAGNANITVHAGSNLIFAGSYAGPPTDTAGNATIHVLGGNNVAGNGVASFANYSTAANANIVIEGAAFAGAGGASLVFGSGSDAGNATILLKSSPISGDHGGSLFFNGGSAPNARITTEAGSLISLVDSGYGDPSLGSVEGAGAMVFNGAPVTIGNLGLSTTFSGPITGVGGSLIKTGAGKFTLSGVGTYDGGTTVEGGILAVNGSIKGDVTVESGATLQGTGTIGGNVIIQPGGRLAPGNSPGTLTVGALSLNDTSILEMELGPISDKVVVQGDAIIDGILNLIIDPSVSHDNYSSELFSVSGMVTDHGLRIGSLSGGYLASDFAIRTAGGNVWAVANLFGDTNHDGSVDSADLNAIINGLTHHLTGWENGDFNRDGIINADDWALFSFGVAQYSASGGVFVPEPTAIWLGCLAATAGCATHRRRRLGSSDDAYLPMTRRSAPSSISARSSMITLAINT